jgi:hypothetical protein
MPARRQWCTDVDATSVRTPHQDQYRRFPVLPPKSRQQGFPETVIDRVAGWESWVNRVADGLDDRLVKFGHPCHRFRDPPAYCVAEIESWTICRNYLLQMVAMEAASVFAALPATRW